MKKIHWTIPFCNTSGTKRYRLDIYKETAETTVDVVELTGAKEVFKTSEDSSENPFESVRGQTGTISIVNEMGVLNLVDELMPRDNTKRFVRLVRLDAAGRRRWTEWQGFLSADSYSQAYTSRPESIDIPVKSLLEAMGSVEAKQDIEDTEYGLEGMPTIKRVIEYCLIGICRKAGTASVVTDYYIPSNIKNGIMGRYINSHDLFSVEERNYEDHTNKYVKGKSLKEVLNHVCAYMGWVARESGTKIYFEDPYAVGYQRYTADGEGFKAAEVVDASTIQMSTLEYIGTGHQKSVTRGKKRVEVKASLTKYDDFELPECPYYEMQYKEITDMRYDGDVAAMQAALCGKNGAFNHITTRYYKSKLHRDANGGIYIDGYQGTATMQEWLDNYPMATPTWDLIENHVAGAGLVRLEMSVTTKKKSEVKKCFKKMNSGLYCTLMPGVTSGTQEPIFSMRSVKSYRFNEGYLHLTASALFGSTRGLLTPGIVQKQWIFSDITDMKNTMKIKMRISVGGMYWTLLGWRANKASIEVEFDESGNFKCDESYKKLPIDTEEGIIMPINSALEGQIKIEILPFCEIETANKVDVPCMVFFEELKMEHLQPFSHILSDDSENTYGNDTGFCYDEDESISVDVATFKWNTHSPSLLIGLDGVTPANVIPYEGGSKKPEVYLLERLKKYYSAPRRVITLDAKKDSIEGDFPLVLIEGYDGKTYIPLSHTRDWVTDQDELMLYEIGDNEPDTEEEEDEYIHNSTSTGGSGSDNDTDGPTQ